MGFFNDIFIANFLESVPVKENLENRSVFDRVMANSWWHTLLTCGVYMYFYEQIKRFYQACCSRLNGGTPIALVLYVIWRRCLV